MFSAPELTSRGFIKCYCNINEGNKELTKLIRDPRRLKTLLPTKIVYHEKLLSTIKSLRTVDKL